MTRQLCVVLELLCWSAMATAQEVASEVERLEQQVLNRTNEIRHRHDLEPLTMNPELRGIARNYSEAMGRRDFFSHSGPQGDTVGDRVRDAGFCYQAVAENLAKNYNMPDPVANAVQGWMQSKGHRRNILTPVFRRTGIGIWRHEDTYYFTQIFLRSFPEDVDCDNVRWRTP